MELPLRLRRTKNGRLVYSIPLWYRICMAALALVVAGSILTLPGRPAPLAWIILVIVALAGLYEERWSFDAEARRVSHRSGLLFAARTLRIPFDEVEEFRLLAHVRGTIPGSEDERERNIAALAAGRPDDSSKKRSSFKKPYILIVFDASDGRRYVLDRMGARSAARLRYVTAQIAEHCGKPFREG